jgi:sugar O-acyltransferase (sialic acid O-acetyltransferase NeuD family)
LREPTSETRRDHRGFDFDALHRTRKISEVLLVKRGAQGSLAAVGPMSGQRVVVFGAGGHGKVVADIVLAAGRCEVVGFLDDRPGLRGSAVLGLPVLGDAAWLEQEAARGPIAVALGVGANLARRAVAERCERRGAALLVAVHPRATVASSARLAPGAVVMAGAVVNPDAAIGRGAIVNSSAVVEHDVVVGDWAHLSPGAATGGAARIGALAFLGLGAVVLPGVSVGDRAVVGAGAIVLRDVPEGVTVVGVPARPVA